MLNVQNVNAGYGKFQALFNVSLDVRAGEAVAVIGPNGAGKSTLLKILSRVTAPTTGFVKIKGKLGTIIINEKNIEKMSRVNEKEM